MPDLSLLPCSHLPPLPGSRQPSIGRIEGLPGAQSRMGTGGEWIRRDKRRSSTRPHGTRRWGWASGKKEPSAWPSGNAAPTPADRGPACRDPALCGKERSTRSTERSWAWQSEPPGSPFPVKRQLYILGEINPSEPPFNSSLAGWLPGALSLHPRVSRGY